MSWMLVGTLLAFRGPAPGPDASAAKQAYTVGEQRLAQGDAVDAVALWRHAIGLVPATPGYDELRHDLVMRLGFGLMVASEQTGDRRYLLDAQTMLLRYAERHPQIAGKGRRAKKEHAEIYEQLYQVESLLDDGTPASASLPSATEGDVGEGLHRKVVVRRRRGRTTVDDPRIRALLVDAKTSPETGLVATMPVLVPYSPARALVRISGRVRGGRDAQPLGRAVIDAAREDLRACFADAYARKPTTALSTDITLTIAANGAVRSVGLEDEIVDRRGARCVREHLAAARVENGSKTAQRLRIPVLFFWGEPQMFDEASGKVVNHPLHLKGVRREMNHGAGGPMPAIDKFAK